MSRHRNSGNKIVGRIIIIAIYILYPILEYVVRASAKTVDDKFVATLIVHVLVATVLTIAMLFGMDLARYLFLFFLAIQIFITAGMFLMTHQDETTVVPGYWILSAFNVIIFFVLIFSRAVRAVTRG